MDTVINGLTQLYAGSASTAPVLHRTITVLDGYYQPAANHASWVENPGHRWEAVIWTNLAVRGCTALADDPILEFRTFLRCGDTVGYGDTDNATRPRLQDAPSIKCQKTVNVGAAYTDYSAAVIDNNVATIADLSNLDTIANGDWIVIGGPAPFCGAGIDMTANVNGNAATMTVEYWNGAAWVAVANLTDGTANGGATFGVDGQISWDIPAAWQMSTIATITAYWVRVGVSAALDAATEIAEIDLFGPITECIGIIPLGYDVLAMVTRQTAAVTGAVVVGGTLGISWV